MRFLFGIIIGVTLTIGGAWIIDQNNFGGLGGPIVNWDRVERGWVGLGEAARFQIRRITG